MWPLGERRPKLRLFPWCEAAGHRRSLSFSRPLRHRSGASSAVFAASRASPLAGRGQGRGGGEQVGRLPLRREPLERALRLDAGLPGGLGLLHRTAGAEAEPPGRLPGRRAPARRRGAPHRRLRRLE